MSDWTVIPDTDTDADSPLTESLLTDMKENSEYLFETMTRSGTHGAPHTRTAMARGVVTDSASTNGSGDTAWQEAAVSYATDSLDGDPDFSVAPVITYGFYESTASATAWGSTAIPLVYIKDGSQSVSGFTFKWRIASGPTSSTVKIGIYFDAIGQPQSGE